MGTSAFLLVNDLEDGYIFTLIVNAEASAGVGDIEDTAKSDFAASVEAAAMVSPKAAPGLTTTSLVRSWKRRSSFYRGTMITIDSHTRHQPGEESVSNLKKWGSRRPYLGRVPRERYDQSKIDEHNHGQHPSYLMSL